MNKEWSRLADICRMRTGKLDSNAAVEDGEFPFFTCAQQTFRIDRFSFDTEAVILGGNNANGVYPLKYYSGQFDAYQRTYVIESLNKEIVDTRYLYFALRPALSHFQTASIGAATQYLTKSILDNFQIRIPRITIQRKAVEVLSAYDDLIENNRRRMELLEQAARLIYREWFVHLRFPGNERVPIKEGVPKGWKRDFLPNVITFNPTEKVPKGEPIRYVPMSCLSTTGLTADLSDSEIRTKATSVKFRNDDVLLARITPCLENGKTGYVYFLNDGELGCGSTEFIVLRGRTVNPRFVYCMARSHDFRESAIKSMTGSSGRQRVQPAAFEDYEIVVPPSDLMDSFDQKCKPMFDQIGVLCKQNEKLAKARDLLLPKLMSGEIRV